VERSGDVVGILSLFTYIYAYPCVSSYTEVLIISRGGNLKQFQPYKSSLFLPTH
jgi:hypothetical protein